MESTTSSTTTTNRPDRPFRSRDDSREGRSEGGRSKGRFKSFAEKRRCRFCRKHGRVTIDFKDIGTLQKLCTSQGKMYSRKRSGNCAYCQRSLKVAIKRARFMALLPYVSR